MTKVQKMFAFYGSLSMLLSDEKFVESSARALVQLFEEIKSIVSIKDVTVEFLREAHEEYRDSSHDLDIMEELAEAAFKDLAGHMRNPEVQMNFGRFADMSGTGADDLYVYKSKVRRLSRVADGIAVVTLVVSDYGKLRDLLENHGVAGKIHSV